VVEVIGLCQACLLEYQAELAPVLAEIGARAAARKEAKEAR
jgi:hypothetical protein